MDQPAAEAVADGTGYPDLAGHGSDFLDLEVQEGLVVDRDHLGSGRAEADGCKLVCTVVEAAECMLVSLDAASDDWKAKHPTDRHQNHLQTDAVVVEEVVEMGHNPPV